MISFKVFGRFHYKIFRLYNYCLASQKKKGFNLKWIAFEDIIIASELKIADFQNWFAFSRSSDKYNRVERKFCSILDHCVTASQLISVLQSFCLTYFATMYCKARSWALVTWSFASSATWNRLYFENTIYKLFHDSSIKPFPILIHALALRPTLDLYITGCLSPVSIISRYSARITHCSWLPALNRIH